MTQRGERRHAVSIFCCNVGVVLIEIGGFDDEEDDQFGIDGCDAV